jgi:hypothetical protein
MQQRSLAVKIAKNTSLWQRASYHKIMKLVEGLGLIEVFQNSHQLLHFADPMLDTLLRALSLCPCMHPLSESAWASANDSQQQQQVRFPLFLGATLHRSPAGAWITGILRGQLWHLFDAVSLVLKPSRCLLQCVQRTPAPQFLLLGFVAGGAHVQPSLELLREPLLEMVRQQNAFISELRVTNTYLRNSACWQFKYTSSQATQHRDPNFKQALIVVRSCQSCKPPPPKLTLLLAPCAYEPTVLVVSAVTSRPKCALLQATAYQAVKHATAPYFGRLLSHAMVITQQRLACLSLCAAHAGIWLQRPTTARHFILHGLGQVCAQAAGVRRTPFQVQLAQ